MGSSSNNRAQQQAEQMERERQAQINANIANIDRMFSSPEREREYGDFLSAMRDTGLQDLSRQKQDNDRQMAFALARSGQAGGSLDVDLGRRADQDYSRGAIGVERLAAEALSRLRGADDDTRNRLTSLATTGADMTTAAQQAQLAMRNNLQSGRATTNMQELGNVFGSMSDIYRDNRRRAEERRGYNAYGQSMYQPGPWASGYQFPRG